MTNRPNNKYYFNNDDNRLIVELSVSYKNRDGIECDTPLLQVKSFTITMDGSLQADFRKEFASDKPVRKMDDALRNRFIQSDGMTEMREGNHCANSVIDWFEFAGIKEPAHLIRKGEEILGEQFKPTTLDIEKEKASKREDDISDQPSLGAHAARVRPSWETQLAKFEHIVGKPMSFEQIGQLEEAFPGIFNSPVRAVG